MFINILILFIISVLLLLLYIILPPDSPWAPWWRTNKKTAVAICKLAKITSKDVVYDLGCGDGEVMARCASLGAKGVGIEVDLIRVLIARLKIAMQGKSNNVIIKRSNFFNEDFSKASVIIVYLVPATLNKLLPRFKKELKKGTRIVSFRYKMELSITGEDVKNKLYLYTI